MQITKREPTGLASLRGQMDRLFDSFLGREPALFSANGDWFPSVDQVETPDEIIVKAELPGIDEKDISVSLSGDNLVIQGERKGEKEEKDKHFHRLERSYGRFERVLPLPAVVDPAKISADYKKGVLEVRLPKKPEARPHEIKVNMN